MTKEYKPVACGFHDRLEHLAIRRTPCQILLRQEAGERTVDGVIADIQTSGGAEYVVLAGKDERIRLDEIVDIRTL